MEGVAEQRFVRGSGAEQGFVSRVIAGETIIVPVSGRIGDLEAIYTLNLVGTRIWELLERPMTRAGLADAVEVAFDVTPDRARSDVDEFLEALGARGLVRIVEGGSDD
jgi:hypothetical protein